MLKSPKMNKVISVLIVLSTTVLAGCSHKGNINLVKSESELITSSNSLSNDIPSKEASNSEGQMEEGSLTRIATTSAKQKIAKPTLKETKSVIDIDIVTSSIRVSSDTTKYIIEGTLTANVSSVDDLDRITVLLTYYSADGILVKSYRNKPILAPGDPRTGIVFKVLSEVVQNSDSYRLQIGY